MPRTKNQLKGNYCERIVRRELKRECIDVVDLKKGADFRCVKTDGSEKLVDAKCNSSSLTIFQKKVKTDWEKSGKEYEIRRCSCQV